MRSSLGRNLLVLCVVGGLGAGCNDRLYDSGETISLIDGGPTGLGGHIQSGGDAGVGGRTGVGGGGGATGSGGAAGVGGSGGAVNVCDETSPLRQTDVANCGRCFNECMAMNADATCVAGACQYSCLAGFFDADKDPVNGCECTPTNNGTELCDGVDNDCNGIVDDGFDMMSDLTNCGGCNRPCYFPFAASSCDMGMCTQGACLPNFYDRDPLAPGCETNCQTSNGGVEICDGIDNDCNGVIDDNVQAATITCKNKGVCAGTLPTCMGTSGYTCVYPAATYQDVEDASKGCDGLDNDCDGLQDEAFGWNTNCVVITGGCSSNGKWVCDSSTVPAGRKCNAPPPATTPEVCDGKDNDCDGKVDELDKISDSNDKLITFTTGGKTVTMFVYEASRVDALTTNSDSAHRPCSLVGRKPWSNVTKEEASASCARIGNGWRLCYGTEWFDACNGSANTTFPYGAGYVASKCNGYDYGVADGAAPIATGAASGCGSDLGVDGGVTLYDMSGNVKEWVSCTPPDGGATPDGGVRCDGGVTYQIRGGAYNTPSFLDNSGASPATVAPGLQCNSSTPAPTVAVRLPSVGFRCCHTGALPP
jgi:hypothetical protein